MSKRLDDALKNFAINCVFGARCKGYVDVVTVTGTFAQFVFKTGVPGKERAGGFMKRDVKDAGIIIEGELDAVSMMGIYIELKDTLVLLKKIFNGDGNIVEITETGSIVGAAMMETPGRAEDEVYVRL